MAAKDQKRITPVRIRRIRTNLGLTQEKFAQVMGTFWTTVNRWESGFAKPCGLSLRLLLLLEKSLRTRPLRDAAEDARSFDPMFVLYRLLEPLYGATSRDGMLANSKRRRANLPSLTGLRRT